MRFLLIFFFILGCTTPIEIEYSEKNKEEIKIYFCPDNCENNLIKEIELSKKYIDCTFFDINLKNVIKALENKNSRLIVDNNNKFEFNGKIKFDTKKQYTHNKFCIIDGKKVITGSFNPTTRGSEFNNNNFIVIPSIKLANSYQNEFNELWNGEFGEGKVTKYPKLEFNNVKIKNYFCPEDNCGNKIYNEIMLAKKEIYFMLFSFTHNKIAKGLVLQHKKGVNIKGVLEKSQNSKYNKYDLLKFQNIDVKWDHNKYNMHNKVFIIDNETVITGSFNPSKNADTNNDENILILKNKEIANKYLEIFKKIYK